MNKYGNNKSEKRFSWNALRSLLVICFTCLILLSQSSNVSASQTLTWVNPDKNPAAGPVNIHLTFNCPIGYTTAQQTSYGYSYPDATGGAGSDSCGSTKSFGTSATATITYLTVSALDGYGLCGSSITYTKTGTDFDFHLFYTDKCPANEGELPAAESAPLPEDQIGAYYPDSDPRTYAWFFDKGICLQYMEDPDMCVWPKVHQ